MKKEDILRDDMTYLQFGDRMMRLSDHDFSHVVMANAPWTQEETERVFLAYRWFMHVGTACWLASVADIEQFWQRLESEYDTLPRKIDRHQTRGARGWQTINYARQISSEPSEILDVWYPTGSSFAYCYHELIKVPDWGPSNVWHGYDMAERVLRWRNLPGVTLKESEDYMYDYPWEVLREYTDEEYPKSVDVARRMLDEFAYLPAPPFGDRSINMQELETILCRFRKYRKNRYEFGKDKATVIKNLKWRSSRLADSALSACIDIGYQL